MFSRMLNLHPKNGAFANIGAILFLLLSLLAVSPVEQPNLWAGEMLLGPAPVLAITQVADATTINSGESIGYTITVSNTGDDTALAVTVRDPLPKINVLWRISPANSACSIRDKVLTCRFGDMAPQATATVHVIATNVPAVSTTYTNTATAQATNHPAVSATTQVKVLCPDIVVESSSPAMKINPGQTITYVIVVKNIGQGTAKSVRVIDLLPPIAVWTVDDPRCTSLVFDVYCNLGDMAPGSLVTITLTGTPPENVCGYMLNDVTARATNEPKESTNNNSSSLTVETVCPAMALSKKPDAAEVNAGTVIGFTLTVENSGSLVRGATLTDPLPVAPGLVWSISPENTACQITDGNLTCQFGDLVTGDKKVVHITSPTTTESCGSIVNSATAKADNNQDVTAESSILVNCPATTP